MKKVERLIISVPLLLIVCIVASFILIFMGKIYYKTDQGKYVYQFMADMNGDGENEKIRVVNRYSQYDQRHTCDAMYTSNRIKIYLDGKKVYVDKHITLGPLDNPEIIDLVEGNMKKKQIYIYSDGGGPAPPIDYLFYIKDDKVVVNVIEPGF